MRETASLNMGPLKDRAHEIAAKKANTWRAAPADFVIADYYTFQSVMM